jgi:hypothetical protein
MLEVQFLRGSQGQVIPGIKVVTVIAHLKVTILSERNKDLFSLISAKFHFL